MRIGTCKGCGRWFDAEESGKPDLCTDCVKAKTKVMYVKLSKMSYAPKKDRADYAESIRKFCA